MRGDRVNSQMGRGVDEWEETWEGTGSDGRRKMRCRREGKAIEQTGRQAKDRLVKQR